MAGARPRARARAVTPRASKGRTETEREQPMTSDNNDAKRIETCNSYHLKRDEHNQRVRTEHERTHTHTDHEDASPNHDMHIDPQRRASPSCMGDWPRERPVCGREGSDRQYRLLWTERFQRGHTPMAGPCPTAHGNRLHSVLPPLNTSVQPAILPTKASGKRVPNEMPLISTKGECLTCNGLLRLHLMSASSHPSRPGHASSCPERRRRKKINAPSQGENMQMHEHAFPESILFFSPPPADFCSPFILLVRQS